MSSDRPAALSVFKVEDMSCSHCVGTIRHALEAALPGAEITIDLGAKAVSVAGDPALATAAIQAAGYEPVLLGR